MKRTHNNSDNGYQADFIRFCIDQKIIKGEIPCYESEKPMEVDEFMKVMERKQKEVKQYVYNFIVFIYVLWFYDLFNAENTR